MHIPRPTPGLGWFAIAATLDEDGDELGTVAVCEPDGTVAESHTIRALDAAGEAVWAALSRIPQITAGHDIAHLTVCCDDQRVIDAAVSSQTPDSVAELGYLITMVKRSLNDTFVDGVLWQSINSDTHPIMRVVADNGLQA